MLKFVSGAVLVCGFVLLYVPASAQVVGVNPLVWQPTRGISLRDPELLKMSTGAYILTGTSLGVVEYPNGLQTTLVPTSGVPYRIAIYSPNGLRQLKPSEGFMTWNNVVYQFGDGPKMFASLPPAKDFNTATTALGRRSTYLFVPKPGASTTVGGFPLQWQMASNTALVPGVYSAIPYWDRIQKKMYLESDVRQDVNLSTTCMLGQELWPGARPDPRSLRPLVCPGRPVPLSVDPTGFDRRHPLSSEVRFEDGGGLVEGGWLYYSAVTQKYYLTYSSGAYDSADEYGGYVAVCDSPTGPCQKVMNQSGSDARRFVAGNSKNYTATGRPYPVIDAKTGVLTDVLFHAHRNADDVEVILRCTNFTTTMLEDFVAGGRSCEFDVAPTSTDVMMRIVIDYASSSGAGTVHGKGIKLADAAGTTLTNGEWFPVIQNGVKIIDPTSVAGVADRSTFPGIVVARRNGSVTIGQFSSSTNKTDYEITDGYIEVRNGSVGTTSELSTFIELHKVQPTRYVDSVPPAYDYLQATGPGVIAFGLLTAGIDTDRFQLNVLANPVAAPTLSESVTETVTSVLEQLMTKLQDLMARL